MLACTGNLTVVISRERGLFSAVVFDEDGEPVCAARLQLGHPGVQPSGRDLDGGEPQQVEGECKLVWNQVALGESRRDLNNLIRR